MGQDSSTIPTHLNLPPGVPAVRRPKQEAVKNSLAPQAISIGPPHATYYFPISLGGSFSGPFATGVFMPNGFTYVSKVDVILFFHGDRDGDYACEHIDQYWGGAYPKLKAAPSGPVTFRDDLNNSKVRKSVLLIAPTLGVNPRYTSASIGDFLDQSAEAKNGFLNRVLHELAQVETRVKDSYGVIAGFEREPEIGKIILAGHSAGGRPLLRQAQLMPTNRICEIWAFDALYGANIPEAYGKHIADAWLEVIKKNPKTQFFDHFGTEWPTKHSQKLEAMVKDNGLKNASFFSGPDGDHFGVLTKNFSTRLGASECLK